MRIGVGGDAEGETQCDGRKEPRLDSCSPLLNGIWQTRSSHFNANEEILIAGRDAAATNHLVSIRVIYWLYGRSGSLTEVVGLVK